MKVERIEMLRVRLMPAVLKPGVLYVSDEFDTAAHLCACGCGAKIRTPLGPTEWSFEETASGPSLSPSIGNWQKGCQSHYWIRRGEIQWAGKWTSEQIVDGRRHEEMRRRAYYDALNHQRDGFLRRSWRWVMSLFKS